MVEWLLLDWIDAEAGGAAIGCQYHLMTDVLADKARAALAFVQLAVAWAQVALYPLAFDGVPPASRMRGFRSLQVSFHFCTP